jgi:hypothetical protein
MLRSQKNVIIDCTNSLTVDDGRFSSKSLDNCDKVVERRRVGFREEKKYCTGWAGFVTLLPGSIIINWGKGQKELQRGERTAYNVITLLYSLQ